MPDIPVVSPLPPIDIDVEAFPVDDGMAPATKETMAGQDMPPVIEAKPVRKTGVSSKAVVIDAEPVIGFGNDIPLALAMRQVVPAEYAFIFDPAIDQSMRVSWNGGRPWDVVLYDMVADAGLGLVIADKKVWVRDHADEPVMQNTKAPKLASVPAPQPEPVPVLSQSHAEPMDVMLKNKKYEISENRKDDWYKKAPVQSTVNKKTDYKTASVIDDNIDYNAISQQHEESYNPSYPRRTPMPVMGEMSDDASSPVTEAPVSLTVMDKAPKTAAMKNDGQSPLEVQDVEMKQPVAPLPVNQPSLAAQSAPRMGHHTVMDPYEIHYWHAEKGDSLRKTLVKWSEQAGVEMFWGAHYDYVLPAQLHMHGTFPDAIKNLLIAYEGLPDRPVGRLHLNMPNGPTALVIESTAVATQ